MDGIGATRDAPPAATVSGIVDDAGFEAAFREHFASVYRFIARRVGPDLADDFAADTFATAYRRRVSYRPDRASLRSWLYGIAVNLLRNHWRTEQRLLERDARLAAATTSTVPDTANPDLEPLLAAALAKADVITFLSCPAATTCRALAATPRRQRFGPRVLTTLTTDHLLTTDDGRHFTTTTFPAADNIRLLSCPTASHCVAAGARLTLVSDDTGSTWHPSMLPRGIRPWTSLDCVDAWHCFQVGLRMKQNDNVLMVSDDGGATWQQRPLPTRYLDPGIDHLACVSVSTCYITGWDDAPQSFGNGKATSGSTSIAAVTQDAGLTWQAIGLPEPSSLPPGEPPDVFLSVSSLQCPKASTCIALADNVAGNKHAAIYTTAP